MDIRTTYLSGRLTLYLTGELDHHEARCAIRTIDELMDEYLPRDCVLDLNGLSFMDSSSKSSNEAFARMSAAAFASQLDPTMDELGDIKTAVSEAVTNCIVHAYPDRIGRVSMRLRILEGGVLEISVRDWGCGIENIERAMEPLFTTGGEDRSGMGFTIMSSFMDKLRVRSLPGKGTTVTMLRTISPRVGRK